MFKLLLLSAITLTTFSNSFAQLRNNSPYSRFGIGDIYNNESGISRMMGGISYGLQSPFIINSKNPASVAAMDSGSFLFDAGYSGNLTRTSSALSKSNSNYFNLDYIKVAFPVTNWWRASLGLSPYSNVGYNVLTHDYVDSIGNIEYSYLGDGGLNRFSWINAFKIGKNLSLGINSSYIFGNINYKRVSYLPDNINAYSFRITNSTHAKGLYFDLGLQYTDTFGVSKKYSYTFGTVFSNNQSISGSSRILAETYLDASTGYQYVKDTIQNINSGEGKINLPMYFGAGFVFNKLNKWSLGADFTYKNWQNYSAFNSNDSFRNSLNLNLGASYKINETYLRLGIRYFDSYLALNGNKINNLGISFGSSIPLRQNSLTFSYLNVGVEIGQMGTTANGLLRQDYIKLFLGLTIKNNWFSKLKYQ